MANELLKPLALFTPLNTWMIEVARRMTANSFQHVKILGIEINDSGTSTEITYLGSKVKYDPSTRLYIQENRDKQQIYSELYFNSLFA